MNRRFVNAVKLVFLVQWRARFPQVYIGFAIAVVVAFRFFIPREYIGWLLPALLFGDPGSLSVFMVAAYRYLERGENSITGLMVTPLSSAEYVMALVVGSAIAPTVGGAVIMAGVMGIDGATLLVIPPLFLTAVISGCIGLMVSAYFAEFVNFLLGSIPVVTAYSLPFLSFFGLAPENAFRWIPSDASLSAFRILAEGGSGTAYVGFTVLLVGFAVLFSFATLRVFETRVREQLEFV